MMHDGVAKVDSERAHAGVLSCAAAESPRMPTAFYTIHCTRSTHTFRVFVLAPLSAQTRGGRRLCTLTRAAMRGTVQAEASSILGELGVELGAVVCVPRPRMPGPALRHILPLF